MLPAIGSAGHYHVPHDDGSPAYDETGYCLQARVIGHQGKVVEDEIRFLDREAPEKVPVLISAEPTVELEVEIPALPNRRRATREYRHQVYVGKPHILRATFHARSECPWSGRGAKWVAIGDGLTLARKRGA